MQTIMKALIAPVLALALGGCILDDIQNAWTATKQTTVSPRAVNIAVNAYNGAARTATNYIRLPPCQLTTSKVCSSDAVVAVIVPAVRSGRVARDNLLEFYKRNPGQLGDQGVYDALVTSVSTIRGALGEYGVVQ